MAEGNQHGFYCPSCGHDDELRISCCVQVYKAYLLPDGIDYGGGDIDWADTDMAACGYCGWEATVGDLLTENDDGWEDVLAEVIRHYEEDEE